MTAARTGTDAPWWHVKKRLNGKFWLIMAFLVSLIFVAGSTFHRVTESVTRGDLEDWREETTRTWKDTLEQLDRIERTQQALLRKSR